MKTITLNVSEPTYRAFQEYASRHDRKASELIRQAMEEFRQAHIRPGLSVTAIEPVSLGRVLRPLDSNDDLLGEMLHADRS